MSKSSGGVRGGGGRITPLRETDKAILLHMEYTYTDYYGNVVHSSMAYDAHVSKDVWIPKSQIEGNAISNWIADAKVAEFAPIERISPWDAPPKFTDASGKLVKIGCGLM